MNVPESKIVTFESDRRQLADKAAALGQQNLILREANVQLARSNAQQLKLAQEDAESLRQEIAMLKRSRMLRLGRRIRRLFNLPTYS